MLESNKLRFDHKTKDWNLYQHIFNIIINYKMCSKQSCKNITFLESTQRLGKWLTSLESVTSYDAFVNSLGKLGDSTSLVSWLLLLFCLFDFLLPLRWAANFNDWNSSFLSFCPVRPVIICEDKTISYLTYLLFYLYYLVKEPCLPAPLLELYFQELILEEANLILEHFVRRKTNQPTTKEIYTYRNISIDLYTNDLHIVARILLFYTDVSYRSP